MAILCWPTKIPDCVNTPSVMKAHNKFRLTTNSPETACDAVMISRRAAALGDDTPTALGSWWCGRVTIVGCQLLHAADVAGDASRTAACGVAAVTSRLGRWLALIRTDHTCSSSSRCSSVRLQAGLLGKVRLLDQAEACPSGRQLLHGRICHSSAQHSNHLQ